MKKILYTVCLTVLSTGMEVFAEAADGAGGVLADTVSAADAAGADGMEGMGAFVKAISRLSLGGYGEAVYTRNFYSDQWQRYSYAENYKNAKSHGRFDLPHTVFYVGYDFGKGWTFGSEIEFEHGGTESAIEIEAEEMGEYESEVERGGEVAMEQFWLQKSFGRGFNIRMGHVVVPVGLTNQYHLPTEFFTVYRPEGESTIFPCTWHETGISFWGRTGKWRYEALFLPGLDADRFGSQRFIGEAAGSPYEFKIANAYAGAFRLDHYAVRGLRMGLSGYFGHSFSNSLTNNVKYRDYSGEVLIGSFDFHYSGGNLILRGHFDWGHIQDSEEISRFNKSLQSGSPSPRTPVASDAVATGIEAGYNLLAHFGRRAAEDRRLYFFGRYEYYDSMAKVAGGVLEYGWCGKHRMAVGFNYFPIKEIVLKGEYSKRFYKSRYNDEPSVSFSVAYAGFFTR